MCIQTVVTMRSEAESRQLKREEKVLGQTVVLVSWPEHRADSVDSVVRETAEHLRLAETVFQTN